MKDPKKTKVTQDTSPVVERFLRYKLVIQGRSKKTVEEYGLDGIDCDWEFPGDTGIIEEKYQHTALFADYRRKLDALSEKTGALEAELAALTGENARLSAEFKAASDKAAALEAELASLKEKAAALEAENLSLTSRSDSLKTFADGIAAMLAGLNGKKPE